MIHFRTTFYDEIPSTSALLLEQAGSLDFHGQLIAAHYQTQGKGRRGRTWETGRGNLAFSVGFRLPAADQKFLPYYPLCVGIAVYDAVIAFLNNTAAIDLQLKWPNDLAWRRKKLMGLLSQVRAIEDYFYLSIGIGLNIAWAPSDLPAICLAEMPLRESTCPAKEQVLEKITSMMEATFPLWQDFSFVKREWENRAKYLGKTVYYGLLEEEEKMQPAQALGLDESGALRVRNLLDGREQLLATEDLSLRL